MRSVPGEAGGLPRCVSGIFPSSVEGQVAPCPGLSAWLGITDSHGDKLRFVKVLLSDGAPSANPVGENDVVSEGVRGNSSSSPESLPPLATSTQGSCK